MFSSGARSFCHPMSSSRPSRCPDHNEAPSRGLSGPANHPHQGKGHKTGWDKCAVCGCTGEMNRAIGSVSWPTHGLKSRRETHTHTTCGAMSAAVVHHAVLPRLWACMTTQAGPAGLCMQSGVTTQPRCKVSRTADSRVFLFVPPKRT